MTQICGDAHVLNFGLWSSPERQLLFDLRDFDETHTGPFEWDVKRLATSLHVLADSEGLAGSVAESAVDAMLRGYAKAMRGYATMGELEVWYDKITVDVHLKHLESVDAATKAEKIVKKQVKKRSQVAAIDRMTEVVHGVRRITEEPLKRCRLPVDDDSEMRFVEEVFDTYYASIPTYLHRLGDKLSKADVVQQIVGVGSVGMRVYLWLAEGQSGRQPILFQIKQATTSVYEEFTGPSPFGNSGERVAVGQRLMQSATDIFLGSAQIGEHDYYVRQFRDIKIIPDGPRIAPILPQFARSCGHALAKSHARSGDPSAIAGYIGGGEAFRDGISGYARAYAAQTVADHRDLVRAVASGDVEVAERAW